MGRQKHREPDKPAANHSRPDIKPKRSRHGEVGHRLCGGVAESRSSAGVRLHGYVVKRFISIHELRFTSIPYDSVPESTEPNFCHGNTRKHTEIVV